jgi:phosphoglycolate phosphatase-like HAD superfamily hydrolase
MSPACSVFFVHEGEKMHRLNARNRLSICCFAILVIAFGYSQTARSDDSLSSWNNGPAKQSIVEFIEKVTTKDGPDFVPPAERIAVFDNDGTLWAEQPTYVQIQFALDRVKALAPEHPEWKDKQPFKAAIKGDLNTVLSGGKQALFELMMATHAGNTSEECSQIVKDWLAIARHPKTGRPYTEMVYQPMLELLAYLRANDFKTYITSGGGIEFMRPWTESVYGIPPEQVIGSSIKTRYEKSDGTPVAINQHIGRRPIAAFGNSDGDLQMLQWTAAGEGLRFCLYVHHTDAKREWAYDRQSHIGKFDKGLDEARDKGWTVVDMKSDWKRIFSFESNITTADTDYQKLVGQWLRPDGGYILDIEYCHPDGKMEAGYYNPRPINISKAQATRIAGKTELFVELRDAGYPGSYYTLTFDSERNRLDGIYHHLGLNQKFEVYFIRR